MSYTARRIQFSRTTILEFLADSYPYLISQPEIVEALRKPSRAIEGEMVIRDLAYLMELGLIREQVRRLPASRDAAPFYTLTAKGKEFVEQGIDWDRVVALPPVADEGA